MKWKKKRKRLEEEEEEEVGRTDEPRWRLSGDEMVKSEYQNKKISNLISAMS